LNFISSLITTPSFIGALLGALIPLYNDGDFSNCKPTWFINSNIHKYVFSSIVGVITVLEIDGCTLIFFLIFGVGIEYTSGVVVNFF